MATSPAKRRKLSHASNESQYASTDNSAVGLAAASVGHRSSSFILQTEELLKEVRPDYDAAFAGANDLLFKLKTEIEDLGTHDALPIFDASREFEEKHRIIIPYSSPVPAEDSPYKVSIEKPSAVNVTGSYVLRTMVKPQHQEGRGKYRVDMVVEMPRALFQEKDYQNLRYFYKRAYYLAHLASVVRKLPVDVTFEYMNDNPLLPVLIISPQRTESNGTAHGNKKEKAGGKDQGHVTYQIQLIPSAPDGLFQKKLHASNSNIRLDNSDGKKSMSSATPFYNSTLKAETTILPYLKLLRQAEKSCPAFKDACVLGRTWLQQRGLDGRISRGGFGNFEFSILVALLLQSTGRKGAPVLSSSLSSTQIFRATVQFLASSDFSTKPCVLGRSGDSNATKGAPVLEDVERGINVAYKMSPWSTKLLQRHAKSTYDLLRDDSADQFNPTFILRADHPLHDFDLMIKVKCPESDTEVATGPDRRGFTRDFAESLFQVLKKALGDRAKQIHVYLPEGTPWSISKSPAPISTSQVLIGLKLDPLNSGRQVDHGPAAEEKTLAKKFRVFWGEQAELRRFKDGSIRETLVWGTGEHSTPYYLCEKIVRWVLKRHLYLEHEDLDFIGHELPSLIPVKPSDAAYFGAAKTAFKNLEKDLRSLEDLPLQIRRVAPFGPSLRSASIKAPMIDSPKVVLHPMEVVISLEASGKWPSNLAGVQRMKVAFLLRIGSSLEEANPVITTHIGLENVQQDIQNLAFLDIIYRDGSAFYPFRLHIHTELEESLLEQRIGDKTLDQHIRTDSARLLATTKRLNMLQLHAQTISTLNTRFPALSDTIRVTKHWFSRHKLSCHFSEEAIELLVLHIFIQPYPWEAPSSCTTGLLRVLAFLSRWDWRTDPLIIDTTASAPDRPAIQTRLEAWRKLDPNLNRTVLFIVTAHDPSGTLSTTLDGRPAPSKVVASRMTMLARSASKLIKDKGIDLDPRELFQPSLAEYDVLIHMSAKALRATLHGIDGGEQRSVFKNLDPRTGKDLLPVPRHPATVLLEELNAAYGGPMLFFHGGGGTDDGVIGALWNPQMERRSFRANLPCNYKPATTGRGDGDDGDDDVMEVNREAILGEIARIGGDLIEKIEVVEVEGT